MKEFWHKHHWAIIATGGILLLIWIYYEYEQAQAANAANSQNTADNAASQLASEELPLIGGGGGVSLPNTGSPTGNGTSAINNYTNTPTPTTASQIPSTSGSGVPNTSPNNAATQAQAPTITVPGAGAAPASPYNTNPGTTGITNQNLYTAAKAANEASFCYDSASGLGPTAGLSACGPQGGGSASNLGTMVSGLLPGQAGYTSALQSEIQADQTADPQAVAGLEAIYNQYGAESESTSPGSGAPAGGTSTKAPITSTTSGPPAQAYNPPSTGSTTITRSGSTSVTPSTITRGVARGAIPTITPVTAVATQQELEQQLQAAMRVLQ